MVKSRRGRSKGKIEGGAFPRQASPPPRPIRARTAPSGDLDPVPAACLGAIERLVGGFQRGARVGIAEQVGDAPRKGDHSERFVGLAVDEAAVGDRKSTRLNSSH